MFSQAYRFEAACACQQGARGGVLARSSDIPFPTALGISFPFASINVCSYRRSRRERGFKVRAPFHVSAVGSTTECACESHHKTGSQGALLKVDDDAEVILESAEANGAIRRQIL